MAPQATQIVAFLRRFQRHRINAVSVCCVASMIVLLRRLWRGVVCPPPVGLYYDTRSIVLARLLPKLSVLLQGHAPAPFIPTGLLQSAMAEFHAPSPEDVPFVRQTIDLREHDATSPENRSRRTSCCPDIIPAGEVSIDWLHPFSQDDPSSPICILVPGLTGSSESGYIRRTAAALASRNVRVACYNPRSRAGNNLEAPFLYSAGYTEDLRRVLRDVIKLQYPNVPLLACGFSLGSSYLVKYVGEEGRNSMFAGVVAVACPIDLLSMSNNLLHSWSGWFVDYILVRSVQKVMAQFDRLLHNHSAISIDCARAAKTMADFDDATIVPMFGFRSAAEYYRASSVGSYLNKIRVPTLFLNAANDPVCPAHLIRRDDFAGRQGIRGHLFEALPIALAVTAEGGHSMVWPQGIGGSHAWAIDVIADFVDLIVADLGTKRHADS